MTPLPHLDPAMPADTPDLHADRHRDIPPDVARVLATLPEAQAARLRELRAVILQAAAEAGVGPLTETLKWSEPAYLTNATRAGTTLRIGPLRGRTDCVAMFVNCRTVMADRIRARHGAAVEVQGDRAVLVPLETDFDRALWHDIAVMGLTYHRWRRAEA